MWGRTLGCAARFLLGDPAQLVHEVAVERALAAVYVPTHHNAHLICRTGNQQAALLALANTHQALSARATAHGPISVFRDI